VFFADSDDERMQWIKDLRWCALNSRLDNGYEIDRVHAEGCLGTGAFSVVWRGRAKYAREDCDESYALKEISKTNLNFKEETSVREEVRIQRRVGEHPNIVFMKEFVETGDSYVLVMELLQGGTLLDLVVDSQQGFSEMGVLSVMLQVLKALVYLHNLGIVHRDLKLENFLLADKGTDLAAVRVVIADFGCAAWVEKDEFGHGLTDLCGSPGYLAPEVIAVSSTGAGYGLKSDMWSMGVILYILLSGAPPFAAATPEESFVKTARGAYDYKLLCACTPVARDFVAKMLEKNIVKRVSAAQAMEHPWMLGEGVGSTPLVIKDNLRSLRGHMRDTTDSLASAAANSSAAKIMSSFASSAAGKIFKRDSVD